VGEIQRSGTEALAALLTRAREDAGVTRRELAERTGLSYPYISQLETGYRGPSPEAMQRLTEVLGVPVDAMVAAMAERDTPRPRMHKPSPRTGPTQPAAFQTPSRWIANPAWAPAPPLAAGAVDAASSTIQRRVRRSPAPRPAVAAPGERETLVTHALQAEAAAAPRPRPDTLVAEIVARLGELPPGERMAALTDIQNQVVRTVVADASTAGPESGDR
jgi:transcriptional regulator with XRE-family HTH domain